MRAREKLSLCVMLPESIYNKNFCFNDQNIVLEHFWKTNTMYNLYNYNFLYKYILSTFSELQAISFFVLHKDMLFLWV